jgi:predicted TIM-barrel fold metal-dependent hydrolase
MIHGGYPHVDQAAYLSHIFNNVWYDTSFMNPLANRGLHERMLTILETAPVTKVMHGSDGYHVPEFFYVAAKWAAAIRPPPLRFWWIRASTRRIAPSKSRASCCGRMHTGFTSCRRIRRRRAAG